MKRLSILVTVLCKDKVPEYVKYLLNELNTVSDNSILVINGIPKYDIGQDISCYCDQLVVRENKNYDAGAYRDVLLKHIGQNELSKYDELILVNDSFYGPFYPLKQVFEHMSHKTADFWGLSKHPNAVYRETTLVEEHLQTYFLVIRQKMLHSEEFIKFWRELPEYIPTRKHAIEYFEKRFTKHFFALGYQWESYTQTEELMQEDLEFNFNPYVFSPYEMVSRFHFPILKRSNFFTRDMEQFANWDDTLRTLQYIKDHTVYDTDLIWDDVLNRFDVNMLKQCLHVNYVIAVHNSSISKQKKVGILINGTQEDGQRVLTELGDVSKAADTFRTNELSEDSFQVLGNYDYLCFINTQFFSNTYYCKKKSRLRGLVENLACDENYISEIIQLFEHNQRLGILFSFDPYFSEIFDSGRKLAWQTEYYEQTLRTACGMNLNCAVSKGWMPEIGTGSFWIRADILRQEKCEKMLAQIFGGRFQDECILPYLAQDKGYYIGEISSASRAARRISDYQFALDSIVQATSLQIESKELYDYHIKLCQLLIKESLIDFCKKYESIYLYGAGEYGAVYAEILGDADISFKAFILSDNQYNQGVFREKMVRYLSELAEEPERVGIVLSLPPNAQEIVERMCAEKGYINIYSYKVKIADI